jgi:hypothetical protein
LARLVLVLWQSESKRLARAVFIAHLHGVNAKALGEHWNRDRRTIERYRKTGTEWIRANLLLLMLIRDPRREMIEQLDRVEAAADRYDEGKQREQREWLNFRAELATLIRLAHEVFPDNEELQGLAGRWGQARVA